MGTNKEISIMNGDVRYENPVITIVTIIIRVVARISTRLSGAPRWRPCFQLDKHDEILPSRPLLVSAPVRGAPERRRRRCDHSHTLSATGGCESGATPALLQPPPRDIFTKQWILLRGFCKKRNTHHSLSPIC